MEIRVPNKGFPTIENSKSCFQDEEMKMKMKMEIN
jgi:hypothetical protein